MCDPCGCLRRCNSCHGGCRNYCCPRTCCRPRSNSLDCGKCRVIFPGEYQKFSDMIPPSFLLKQPEKPKKKKRPKSCTKCEKPCEEGCAETCAATCADPCADPNQGAAKEGECDGTEQGYAQGFGSQGQGFVGGYGPGGFPVYPGQPTIIPCFGTYGPSGNPMIFGMAPPNMYGNFGVPGPVVMQVAPPNPVGQGAPQFPAGPPPAAGIPTKYASQFNPCTGETIGCENQQRSLGMPNQVQDQSFNQFCQGLGTGFGPNNQYYPYNVANGSGYPSQVPQSRPSALYPQYQGYPCNVSEGNEYPRQVPQSKPSKSQVPQGRSRSKTSAAPPGKGPQGREAAAHNSQNPYGYPCTVSEGNEYPRQVRQSKRSAGQVSKSSGAPSSRQPQGRSEYTGKVPQRKPSSGMHSASKGASSGRQPESRATAYNPQNQGINFGPTNQFYPCNGETWDNRLNNPANSSRSKANESLGRQKEARRAQDKGFVGNNVNNNYPVECPPGDAMPVASSEFRQGNNRNRNQSRGAPSGRQTERNGNFGTNQQPKYPRRVPQGKPSGQGYQTQARSQTPRQPYTSRAGPSRSQPVCNPTVVLDSSEEQSSQECNCPPEEELGLENDCSELLSRICESAWDLQRWCNQLKPMSKVKKKAASGSGAKTKKTKKASAKKASAKKPTTSANPGKERSIDITMEKGGESEMDLFHPYDQSNYPANTETMSPSIGTPSQFTEQNNAPVAPDAPAEQNKKGYCYRCCPTRKPETRSCSCYANLPPNGEGTQTPTTDDQEEATEENPPCPNMCEAKPPCAQKCGAGNRCCNSKPSCCPTGCRSPCNGAWFYNPYTCRYYYYNGCGNGCGYCSGCCHGCCIPTLPPPYPDVGKNSGSSCAGKPMVKPDKKKNKEREREKEREKFNRSLGGQCPENTNQVPGPGICDLMPPPGMYPHSSPEFFTMLGYRPTDRPQFNSPYSCRWEAGGVEPRKGLNPDPNNLRPGR